MNTVKRTLVLMLVFLLIFTGTAVGAYGDTPDNSGYVDDPYSMMVDEIPDLKTVDEIIDIACPEEISKSAIDAEKTEILPSDYENMEGIQQLIESGIVDLNESGNGIQVDQTVIDTLLKEQQELVEESKTDRFIVKYKEEGEDSFKEKLGDTLEESINIDSGIVESPYSSNDSAVDIYNTSPDTVDSVNWKNDSSTDLIILDDSVYPSEFVETLKKSNAEDDIEYIQPDFEMELNALNELTSEGSINENADDPENYDLNSNSMEESTPTDDAIVNDTELNPSENSSGEAITIEIPEDTISDSAITTNEAIEEIPLVEIQENNVIVAVIDTGMDITHSDLDDFIYSNPNEIPGNNIDDDSNGYIDDINGWSFPDNTGEVYIAVPGLEQAHATHIAGIISGLSNADENLSPSEHIQILPLKVFKDGIAYTSDIIAAIDYAEMMGARVVNCSFGSTDDNPALFEAIKDSDMLFVCSAGNSRIDLEDTPIYPACFDLDNLICVTSTNADGGLSYFSNYSADLVDIAAHGRDIMSTLPDNAYGLQSGTSMSTALVSGIAAAVLSTDDSLDSAGTKVRLLSTSNKLSNLQETISDGRQVSFMNAVANQIQTGIIQNIPANDYDAFGYTVNQIDNYQLYSSNIIQVAAGNAYTLVLRTDGTVWSWGLNDYGQCGTGTTSSSINLTKVIGLTNVIAIAAGYEHSLAVKSDGTVWAWGTGGRLGDGTNTDRYIPVQVSGLTNVIDVSANLDHSLALKSDGTVWAWGGNLFGGLGDGTTTTRLTPVQVSNLTGVNDIAAGYTFSLASKSDGTVWGWGANGLGQQGNNNTLTYSTTPSQTSNITSVTKIAAGTNHGLALKSDGTVWAWGGNGFGQLGNGTIITRRVPVQVSGLNNVVNIAAGYLKSMAVKSDGTVRAWGCNTFGQIGDGTILTRLLPTQVSNLTGAAATASGVDHGLAVKSDGTVWAWGSNASVQLGRSGISLSYVPLQCQLFYGLLSFIKSTYTALIPDQDTNTITVSAIGTDIYGNTITTSGINYLITVTSSGVSIDSSTGAVTISPTAIAGSIPVVASYNNLTCSTILLLTNSPKSEITINCTSGESIYIPFNIESASDLSNLRFLLNYDSDDLDIVDLISQTKAQETSAGAISSCNIEILSCSPGAIEFRVDDGMNSGELWSGVINIFKFRAKTTGQTSLSGEYN